MIANNNLFKLTYIGERFGEYLDYKEVSMSSAARITNTSPTQISNIIKGKKYGTDKLIAILDGFRDLNPMWLLFEEGEMLRSYDADIQQGNNNSIVSEPKLNYKSISSEQETIKAQRTHIESLNEQLILLLRIVEKMQAENEKQSS